MFIWYNIYIYFDLGCKITLVLLIPALVQPCNEHILKAVNKWHWLVVVWVCGHVMLWVCSL